GAAPRGRRRPSPPPPRPLGGCAHLEAQLASARELRDALESDINDLFWDIDEAQDAWDASQRALKVAQGKLESAQKAFDAVPKSHDAYWDHLNADGSPAIEYR